MIFTTERLVAREWTDDDAEAVLAIYSDEDVVRFLGSVPAPVESLDAARERLARWHARNAAAPDGYGFWALATNDGTVVGSTLLLPLGEDGEVEVGWHLGKAFWGKGYATESARAAVTYGFETLGLDVIHAVVDPVNAPSLAVARRIGMTHEGRTDRFYDRTLELFSIRP